MARYYISDAEESRNDRFAVAWEAAGDGHPSAYYYSVGQSTEDDDDEYDYDDYDDYEEE